MSYLAKTDENNQLVFGQRDKEFREFAKQNPTMRYEVKPLLPESDQMRGYFEGPMTRAFATQVYLIPNPSYQKLQKVREEIKAFFLGVEEEENPFGVTITRVRSSKGSKALTKIVEMATDWLMQNGYKVPNPELYKHWQDKESIGQADFEEWRVANGYEVDDFPRAS